MAKEKVTAILAEIETFYEKIHYLTLPHGYSENRVTEECLSSAVSHFDTLDASNLFNEKIIGDIVSLVENEQLLSLASFKEKEVEDLEREQILSPETDYGSETSQQTEEEYFMLLYDTQPLLTEVRNKLEQFLENMGTVLAFVKQ